MQFWIRHTFLILACVVLPFMVAIYLDTDSELKRTERAGDLGVRLEATGFESFLMLDAHTIVGTAISLAQSISDRDLLTELAAKPAQRHEAAVTTIAELLKEAAPPSGFAWLIDEDGAVIAKSGQPGLEDKPQLITGHPLFLETQEGYALDGLWKGDKSVALTGAAPINIRGQALGAVFVGRTLDRKQIVALSKPLNAEVSLVADDKIITTTMEEEIAATILKATSRASEPVASGTLSNPLSHRFLPLLPLFVAHDARGLAFTSLERPVPGSPNIRWLITIRNERMLKELALRQEQMLTGMLMFTMLAILIGLMNHRTFVSPIQKLTDHLSELQLGRGELEYPESKVSGPLRRMVKLINMTVQKVPARGFSTRPSGTGEMPIADLGTGQLGPRDIGVAGLLKTADIKHEDMMQAYAPPSAASTSSSQPIAGTIAAPEPPAEADRPITTSSFVKQNVFDGDNALADAVAAIARAAPPSTPPADPTEVGDDEEAAAIAAAIASLESRPPSSTSTPPSMRSPRSASKSSAATPTPSGIARSTQRPGGIRSASEIRGVPSAAIGSGAAGPDLGAYSAAEEGETIRPSFPGQDVMIPTSGARGGGSLASYAGVGDSVVDDNAFNPEATVVAPVQDELLRRSARPEVTDAYQIPSLGAAMPESTGGDMTMVASVPANLLAQTIAGAEGEEEPEDGLGLDPADHAHFKETYERFIEMRRRCGEATGDLAFDRFLAKLTKNREGLIKKYNCRTVRFQVYEKDGKAALKATPVRAR